MNYKYDNNLKPEGKLGVLIVGLNGAVSTTFLTGVFSILKGISLPIGSISQMGTIRIGSRNENNFPLIKEIIPLAEIKDIIFGGWDIRNENCYESALYAKVLKPEDIESVKNELQIIKPMKGVFEQQYVKNLNGEYIKEGGNKYAKMMMIREDIRKFKNDNNIERVVIIWCASTEVYILQNGVHHNSDEFVKAMKTNHTDISPSMLYAYAAISEGCPFINGAPNLSCEIPTIVNYAIEKGVPIAGKDFKTGQTLIKTVISPMLKAKMLGLKGWFSTNILGNRDGEVLDDPDSFKTKEESKLSVLKNILQPDLYPDLYSNYYHKVRINYYPPRGDDKEGWDNIDIFGWMGYPMQIKIDFLCKDSILAAPLVLDLALFMDFAQRTGFKGIQDWLSFYFKSPIHYEDNVPEHDLFIQQMKLKNTLRKAMGYEIISHVDYEYVNSI
ncbi:MAG: inositol-3-phosphate synthase [Ignavibacteria bacterium]|jgi:myo-inositol-1-phosphate synthase